MPSMRKKEIVFLCFLIDNQTDEGSAVAESITEQNTDHDMLSDLDIETLKDIPDKTDASQNHSGSGKYI